MQISLRKLQSHVFWFDFRLILVFSAIVMLTSCKQKTAQSDTKQTAAADYMQAAANPEYLHRTVKNYTDIIISDLFSPPVSSRNYTYASIAAYEVLRNLKPGYASLKGQLKDFPDIPAVPQGQTVCFPVAGIQAFYATGKKFIFSEPDWTDKEETILKEMKALGIPQDVYDHSIAYGNAVADAIKTWADGDNYKETRSMPKHTTNYKEGHWRPTPPDYNEALEPNWYKMRSFVFDSTNMVECEPHIPFSKNTKSTFWDNASEVMSIGNQLKPEQRDIAIFWDDNPVVTMHSGHAIYDNKKMTPGGHWLNVVRIASEKAKVDMLTASEAYMYVSLGLYEAFRGCWLAKHKSDLIRPESYINQYIDPKWKPLLQTPPFPEHSSGHSTISAASAEICTYIFGDNFAYTDNTEEEYGNGTRSFTSFYQAALEASLSRVYGGIHYRHGCDSGNRHGLKIGKFILDNVKTRPSAVGMK